jgi:hypothetical protein
MSNCPQINNTTIIGTSAVTYDSTPLPCTNVTTCDGLNDILSKFDAIICDVKASVDILTEEIIDITEDIMIITEDIININSQLEICCPNCNFSGTANQILNCNFTGTANQLPDPTTTTTSSSSTSTTTSTTTTAVPTTTTTTSSSSSTTTTTSSSSTSTTTSSSTSSTTTTTTTIFCDCYVYEVTVTEQDISESVTGIVYVDVDQVCFAKEPYTFEFNKDGIETICVSRTNTFIEQYIYISPGSTEPTSSQPVKLNECCLTPMFISTESNETSSPVICDYALITTLYIKTVGLNKYAYINPEGTIPFDGLNRWWHIQILGDASGYVEIRSDGRIEYPISYC